MVNRMPFFEWEDGQEIEGIYDEEKELLTKEDHSDDAPSVIDEDNMEEQIERVEEIENNIDTERTENVITDNEEDENENTNNESGDDKINNDKIFQSKDSSEISESKNEYMMIY